jgi:hypothetical protein
MVDSSLFGILAAVALIALLVFAGVMFVYVRRLMSRPSSPLAEEIGGTKAVLAKVRRREPMSGDEIAFAAQAIKARSSWMVFSIPATVFTIGCFYVFGSLEQLHGATPSERTFLGVIPMISALNITAQILRNARLKGRLPKAPSPAA